MLMDAELARFEATVRGAEPEIDLARVALMVARIEYPELEPAAWLARLDDLAAGSGARDIPDPRVALGRLRRFLFEEQAFRGNAEHYFDPRNSCLNEVLERRLGIPITLSIVTMEVGRRVGLVFEGVGLPGHFVVRARVTDDGVLIDPFHGGQPLTQTSAARVAEQALGHPVSLAEEHFAAVTKVHIVARMLTNLKSLYVQQEDWPKAMAAIDRLLLLGGPSPIHIRDRGTVLMKLGDFHGGAAEWERYLTRYPNARDASSLRGQLKQIRQALASLN
jgi:regulator of sirC expression with transglutaminase-like and TPR domain